MIQAPLGVQVPSTIEDLTALFAAGFVKWNGSAFVRGDAVDNAIHHPLPKYADASFRGLNLSSGDNTISLPTIPVGYKLFMPAGLIGNPTAAGITHTPYLRRGGINYIVGFSAFLIGVNSTQTMFYSLFLQAGDSVVINGGGAGLIFTARGYLVPDSDALKGFSTILTDGDNVIYTCPPGKVAFLYPAQGFNASTPSSSLSVSNASGSTRIYNTYIVPSGGPTDVTTRIGRRSQATGGTSALSGALCKLVAGDSLIVNSDGAGDQIVLGSVYEIDA